MMEALDATAWAAQIETSPTNQRLHVQFYFHTRNAKRFSVIHRALPGAHVEKARNNQESWTYCQKEETRTGWSGTFGQVPRGQGGRSDLARAVQLTLERGVEAVVQEDPVAYVRFGRGLRDLELRKRSRDLMQYKQGLTVTVFWGPTGTGKTRRVAEMGDVYPLELADNLWFDGYTGQRRLLIDEFYGQLKPAVLLKLLDVYTRSWPVKGGFVVGDWSEIYITSNVDPDSWYGASVPEAVKAAIRRRITSVEYVGPTDAAPGNVYTGQHSVRDVAGVRDGANTADTAVTTTTRVPAPDDTVERGEQRERPPQPRLRTPGVAELMGREFYLAAALTVAGQPIAQPDGLASIESVDDTQPTELVDLTQED